MNKGSEVQGSAQPPAQKTAGQIEKETKEWILILKKLIGQDQPDRQDTAAFGQRPSRRRRKNPVNPVNPVKKVKIESIPYPFNGFIRVGTKTIYADT